MNSNITLYVTSRREWRSWLENNFDFEKEAWLVYPKKSSGKPRIPYNDAVEEALCFGWIDSTVKSMDEHHSMQRFTPRNKKSTFSQANKERLKWLAEQNMIHPPLQPFIEEIIHEKFTFPNDILEKIQNDRLAWENYQHFSDSYKRIRVAYIDSARKRPDEFEKRLQNFIRHTRLNKIVKGYGGIEKYY